MANSVDPDPTAPIWSGSTLFAQTCLSENLGTLQYILITVMGLSFQTRSDRSYQKF